VNFRLEKFANNLLHQKYHPGLLPLLAFYNHGDSCNLIFPLADGDLMSYFREQVPPRNAYERLKFIEAISILTSALRVIHNGESDQEGDAGKTEIYGYHRDLKYSLPRQVKKKVWTGTDAMSCIDLIISYSSEFPSKSPGGPMVPQKIVYSL